MKRAAESELVAETRPPQPAPSFGFSSFSSSASSNSNPFAGISLLGASSSSSSLFTSAASNTACGTGFSLNSQSSAPAKPAASEAANPFMGLSLFSKPAATGSVFTATASSLQNGASSDAAASFTGLASQQSKEGKAAASASSCPGNEDDVEEADANSDAAQDQADQEDNAEEEEEEPAGDEQTGEEDEEVIFRTDCKLWKLVKHGLPDAKSNGSEEGWRWQERGCGVVHINRHKKTGSARLVMRMRGVLKLLLNTPVFPTTKYEKVGQKSVRFVGVDAELEEAKDGKGEVSLSAFRLNLQSGDQQGKFLSVVQDLVGAAAK